MTHPVRELGRGSWAGLAQPLLSPSLEASSLGVESILLSSCVALVFQAEVHHLPAPPTSRHLHPISCRVQYLEASGCCTSKPCSPN